MLSSPGNLWCSRALKSPRSNARAETRWQGTCPRDLRGWGKAGPWRIIEKRMTRSTKHSSLVFPFHFMSFHREINNKKKGLFHRSAIFRSMVTALRYASSYGNRKCMAAVAFMHYLFSALPEIEQFLLYFHFISPGLGDQI